jgi:PD-(D/E)XK nuclease superfamily protein
VETEIIWSTNEWARAIAALPRTGPLPSATVFVPRAAVAHALRKELVRLERRDVLAGTLFVSPEVAASEVLGNAGVEFREGEAALRPGRVRALLRSGLPFDYFDLALLREAYGWDAAFARAIGELEAAGVMPEDLEDVAGRTPAKKDASRLGDVATVWRALDKAAGTSWTFGRILREAGQALIRASSAWPYPGPTLAAVTGFESAVEARFVRAAPDVLLVALAGRPARSPYLVQAEATLGADFASAVRRPRLAPATGSELALLRSYLFEVGAALDPTRPRSEGPDGTVYLEEHAGIEEEMEAAVEWTARAVFERRTPVEEIGLLLAEIDPFAALLVDRLARHGIRAHVSGGIPFCTTATGSRALAIVRAIRAHLGFEALAEVLPTLRLSVQEPEEAGEECDPKDRKRLSRGAAREVAFGLGTVGGNAGHPRGALDWSACLDTRREALKEAIMRAEREPTAEDDRDTARLVRIVENLSAIAPALVHLVDLARASLDNVPLRDLSRRLAAFLTDWLLAPGNGRASLAALTLRFETLAAEAHCGSLVGDDALRTIEDTLLTLRVPVGRYGDPSVHIDTIGRAVALPFRAVRILGLAEGAFPSPTREDAVLPERVRSLLDAPGLSRVGHATGQLHAIDRIVRDASEVIVFSAPRLSADRTYREPSSIFVEVATALGRPNARTGAYEGLVPTSRALRRDGFLPAHDEANAFRRATPLTETAWQDRVASLATSTADPRAIVPGRWLVGPHLDLRRIASLQASFRSSLDGMLGDAARWLLLPGLTPERALSASALSTLLQCPHRFLFERGFGWRKPNDAPNPREIEALTYGSLFHSVAERFFNEHGTAFGAREGELHAWHQHARSLADREFDALLGEYPLTGEAVRAAQRERLHTDMAALLEHEFGEKGARFVETERAFGVGSPLAWPTAGGPVHLVGYIDRIDVVGGSTRVRDLKTGKAHARRSGSAPEIGRDIQAALYALVAGKLAREWKLPLRVEAQYVYANARGVELRDWNDEMDALVASGQRWLEIASELLRGGHLPRSPKADDCTFCDFKAVCGERRNVRAAQVLERNHELHAFRALKEEG